MTEKETFANSLDRLIYPHIDILTTLGATVNDKETEYTQDFDLELGLVRIKCVLDDQSILSVHIGDNLVYERIDGHTTVCKPGEWVLGVFEEARAQTYKDEVGDLEAAIESATERAGAFEPVPAAE